MALTTCPDCGKEISDKATQCIHCGCPIEQEGNATKDKIKEINGITVNIDELIRDARGNSEAMANRLRSLTGISRSDAKRITGIAFRNRGIKPMGFFETVSERNVVCSKCGSRNVDFSNQQWGEVSKTKGKIKPGNNKLKYKDRTNSFTQNKTIGICQECGHKWTRF